VSSVERSGLTLHFDKLTVLSMPKEAALLYPAPDGTEPAIDRRMKLSGAID